MDDSHHGLRKRLLADLDKLDWPEATKARQRDWIGKSEGAVVRFELANNDAHLEVFTTRPDTLLVRRTGLHRNIPLLRT